VNWEAEIVVVGAGVVGLAVAREFARSGREVLIIEQESNTGLHISSRNSEVIHAGIYYEPNSLKAKFCKQGNELLYEYCINSGVAFKKLGKLIVAQTAAEVAKLHSLHTNAVACGINDLTLLDGKDAMRLEPELQCVAALHSPSTGIVDSRGLMLALLGDAEAHGAVLAKNNKFASGRVTPHGISVQITDLNGANTQISAKAVINCAGHGAHAVAAAIEGFDKSLLPPRFLAKGSYCSVSGRSPFSHLIYPLPVPGALGIHVTNDMQGMAKLGPDLTWVSEVDYGIDHNIAARFKTTCKNFWPGVESRKVSASYCGIRPKISGPGDPNSDFVIQEFTSHGVNGLVNLFGIESPGLTAALAMGKQLLKAL
jgi:L-2-hydroxyglutarate oxidase LhgO